MYQFDLVKLFEILKKKQRCLRECRNHIKDQTVQFRDVMHKYLSTYVIRGDINERNLFEGFPNVTTTLNIYMTFPKRNC